MTGHGHERCIPLRKDFVPGTRASWTSIQKFALTFSGYEFLGDRCADVANEAERRFKEHGSLPAELGQLRSCLFFEQRRYRHMDTTPTGPELAYIRALVKAIREQAEDDPFAP